MLSKILSVGYLLILVCLSVSGQAISGKVIDALTNTPLIYASVGIMESQTGTITNESGIFNLQAKDIPLNSKVRVSMIGYKSQIFSLSDLLNNENVIKLEDAVFELSEVKIKPSGDPRKIGTSGFNRGEVCGFRGTDTGKGCEIGTKIELGENRARLNSFHIYLVKQSFDSCLFRLHIRDLSGNMPGDELLHYNILIPVKKASGWIEADLKKFNLVFSGDIAVSLEWIKITGLNKDKLVTLRGEKQATPTIFFGEKQNKGTFFSKWGSEASWNIINDKSPSIYLTVQ
jgi:hypothetical protein